MTEDGIIALLLLDFEFMRVTMLSSRDMGLSAEISVQRKVKATSGAVSMVEVSTIGGITVLHPLILQ